MPAGRHGQKLVVIGPSYVCLRVFIYRFSLPDKWFAIYGSSYRELNMMRPRRPLIAYDRNTSYTIELCMPTTLNDSLHNYSILCPLVWQHRFERLIGSRPR